jgi:hypothetical protein
MVQQQLKKPARTQEHAPLDLRRPADNADDVRRVHEEREVRRGEQDAAADALDLLEAEIAQRLSDNPEEFVLRFIQTDGQ